MWLAIHAYDLELQRVVGDIKDPLLAEIRLAWWREQVQALAAGGEAPAQPLLQALAAGRAAGSGVDLAALSRLEDGVLPLLADEPLPLMQMAESRGAVLFAALAQAMGAAPLPEGAGTAFALGRLARGPWGHVGVKLLNAAWPQPPARVRLPGPLAALDALGRDDLRRARAGQPPAPLASAGRQWRMWRANLTG